MYTPILTTEIRTLPFYTRQDVRNDCCLRYRVCIRGSVIAKSVGALDVDVDVGSVAVVAVEDKGWEGYLRPCGWMATVDGDGGWRW